MEKKSPNDILADLYATYYEKCFSFTKSYVHDKHTAEDITSDAFIKLHDKLQKEEIKNVPAYLLTILKNGALDHLRQKAVTDRTHTAYTSMANQELDYRISTLIECDPELIFSKEIQEIIDKTLAAMPPRRREIFTLSRYKNLSNKAIAAKLNLSVKSIEYHITKSLSLFRENLKDYLPLFYLIFLF